MALLVRAVGAPPASQLVDFRADVATFVDALGLTDSLSYALGEVGLYLVDETVEETI